MGNDPVDFAIDYEGVLSSPELNGRLPDYGALVGFFLGANPQVRQLNPSFAQVLCAYDVRIPSEKFLEWHKRLSEISRASEAGRSQLISTLLEPLGSGLIQLARDQHVDDWGRAVAVITIEVLSQALKTPWPPEFWECYAPDALANVKTGIPPILAILERLYTGPAQTPLAAPLQFFHIAQACLLVPELIHRTVRSKHGPFALDEYFNVLELVAKRQRLRTYHLVGLPEGQDEDWCFRYLANRFSRLLPSRDNLRPARFVTANVSWYETWMREIFRGRHPVPTLAIVGRSASGRRTILESFDSAILNGVPLGRRLGFKRKESGAEISLSDDRSVEAVIYDSDDISKSDEHGQAVERLRTSSTIVLVVPASNFRANQSMPEEILSDEGVANIKTLGTVLERLELGKKADSKYSIAIAYTKADEYGSVPSGHIRIFETPSDWKAFVDLAGALKDWDHHNEDDAAWHVFVRAISQRKGAGEDAIALRTLLLNGTRLLWETVARDLHSGRASINGYIVNAQLLLEGRAAKRQWSSAGCLQILVDMLYEDE